MLSAARIEQLYPIKTGMDSPNTKISRGNWSLVVVRKFVAECIISYRNGNENSEILLTNRDFHLQTGNLGYKTGFSFTNGESWVTKGILSLLFTSLGYGLYYILWFWIFPQYNVKHNVDKRKHWPYTENKKNWIAISINVEIN